MFSKIIETKIGGLDLCIIKTGFGFHVRYGLDVSKRVPTLAEALDGYNNCVRHALACEIGEDAA